MNFELCGTFNIEFVGGSSLEGVEIFNAIHDPNGHYIYLVGAYGTIYNWSNILTMKRVTDG